MSLDRSLKSASSLVRHRNVLSRAERIEKLTEMEKWDDKKSVFGLPKVAHRKVEQGKGDTKEAAEGAEGAVAATPAAAGAAAGKAPAGAAGAKGAAPAAAGKAPAAGKAAAPAAPAAKKK